MNRSLVRSVNSLHSLPDPSVTAHSDVFVLCIVHQSICATQSEIWTNKLGIAFFWRVRDATICQLQLYLAFGLLYGFKKRGLQSPSILSRAADNLVK